MADAPVMPAIVSTNTNLTVLAIAERAAAILCSARGRRRREQLKLQIIGIDAERNPQLGTHPMMGDRFKFGLGDWTSETAERVSGWGSRVGGDDRQGSCGQEGIRR